MDPQASKKQKCEEAVSPANMTEIDALRCALREKEAQLKEKSKLVSTLQTEANNREAVVVNLKTQVVEQQTTVTKLQQELVAARGGTAPPTQPNESNG